jgi:hypothetical protein
VQEDVKNASALYQGYCAGDVMRFQILRGRLWVDFRTKRTKQGWFPAKLGPGGCRRTAQCLWCAMPYPASCVAASANMQQCWSMVSTARC